MKTCLAILFCLLFLPSLGQAQIVFNPTSIQFQPSPDHNTILSDGSSLLTGYRVKFFLQGATQPLMQTDICKPPIGSNGWITAVSACPSGPLFGTPLVVNTNYVVAITAYGGGGESALSSFSNPFVLVNAPRGIPSAPVVQ